MVYREIGKRIQQAREESGLTQEELAAKLGCTQAALSNYELGKRRLYLSLLNEMARILNKPFDYFMDWTVRKEDDSVSRLLLDPELKELLVEAARLPSKERKLVLDFINWRNSQT
ncbi:MAG: helix-turn-helix transcriptional regulator [Dehalococcoidia bacterium]|nr:helix-turn-helix transcriptional regulator [Dehalococcoidia bacterium]MDD5495155.1 helix-turn-helix transcriptional regulator [Dehalococcoidia bacterium]